MTEKCESEAWDMRVGMGYDVHKLAEGRPLILGGVHVPYEKGLLGHSDADVLCMPSVTHCLEPRLWGISAGIFRIQTQNIKVQTAWNC